jgi:hypothetical protein
VNHDVCDVCFLDCVLVKLRGGVAFGRRLILEELLFRCLRRGEGV